MVSGLREYALFVAQSVAPMISTETITNTAIKPVVMNEYLRLFVRLIIAYSGGGGTEITFPFSPFVFPSVLPRIRSSYKSGQSMILEVFLMDFQNMSTSQFVSMIQETQKKSLRNKQRQGYGQPQKRLPSKQGI
jgi:hypothetical protein